MKKLLLFLIALIFLAVSCSSSKKAENDADLMPDEDGINDEDAVDQDEYEEAVKPDKEQDDTDGEETENIDSCDPNPCFKIENSNGECTAKNTNKYSCGCVDGHFWDGEKCVNPCDDKECQPHSHCHAYNHVDVKCLCDDNFFERGDKCFSPCDPNPCKNDINSTDECTASTIDTYFCGCVENYFWNEEKCVSPCDSNPCIGIENSNEKCTAKNAEKYSCGCVENYFWDSEKCVNPCDAEPCKDLEHSDNKCESRDPLHYTCGCDEGFYWWGKNKGCIEMKPDLAHICTGQTKCYDNEKEIECPAKGEKFYGQDAQYADLGYCAPPSYTIEQNVENEPVVIDNYTGLSWQQKVYVPGKSIGWSRYKNYCETLNYGGYDDWRLPSILEYRTIMDFGKHNPNVDPKYFPDTPPEYFVTSTYTSNSCGSLPHVTPATWVSLIKFDHFETDTYTGCSDDPSFNLPARCVRGNKSFGERSMSELNVSGNKSLYVDNKNSLLWAGAPGNKWADALDYCENLTFAGFSDWHLTNINESSLFRENLNNRDPAYSYYYSSTTEEYDPTRSVQNKLKTHSDYVLCVRDNPCETGEIWDGTKCMKNPCADLPCKNIEHSDKKICTPVSEDVYSCSCNYYYYWNFNSLKCIESCKSQPCEGKSYSTKECFDDDFKGYSCGCVEGYSWDSASKRCVKDEKPDETSDADTDETPDSDGLNNGE